MSNIELTLGKRLVFAKIILLLCLFLHYIQIQNYSLICISGEDCRFGPGCAFPCRCGDSDEQCDPETGDCRTGCRPGILENTDWRGPGCIIGRNILSYP